MEWLPTFFTSDVVTTLTLTHRPSKHVHLSPQLHHRPKFGCTIHRESKKHGTELLSVSSPENDRF